MRTEKPDQQSKTPGKNPGATQNQQGALNMEKPDTTQDRVIWRRELQEKMHVSGETMRRWLRDKKLPEPDVDISSRTKGWKLSTLHAAGILLA